MMLKEKSSPWAKLKYLYVLPLAAIAVTAFARSEVSNELKEISEVKVNEFEADAAINAVENEALPQQSDSSKVKQANTRVYVINEDQDDVPTNFNVNLTVEGVRGVFNDSHTVLVDRLSVESGNPDKPMNVNVTVLKDKPLVLVEGKESTSEILKTLDAHTIERVEVLKDHKAVEEYGDRGKNGVILITLKTEEAEKTEE